MNDSKHTPGPWEATRGSVYNHICVEGGGGVGCPESDLGRVSGCVDKSETARANACLMAAAPDLLEAAQFFLSYEEATHEEREWIIRSAISHFKAAIAKAQGTER